MWGSVLAPPTQARLSGDRSLLARFTRKGIWGEVKDARESQVSKIALDDPPPNPLKTNPSSSSPCFPHSHSANPQLTKANQAWPAGEGGSPPPSGA